MSALSHLYASSGTGDVQLRTSSATVHGLSVRETAGAAASFVLRDGTASSDPAIICMNLGADESVTFELSREEGIQCTNGLFLDRVSGTTEIAVWV